MRARDGLDFELRTISKEEVCYDLHFPVEEKTDRLSQRIVALDPENIAVQWRKRKRKNSPSERHPFRRAREAERSARDYR